MSILRFKCQETQLLESLKYFSQFHRHDDNKTLDIYFKEWLDTNKALVDKERQYLETHQYPSNIEDKLYKSIKYYYIKKYSTEVDRPKVTKRSYEHVPKELMEQIRQDIHAHWNENPRFKPSHSFEAFKRNHSFDENKLKKAYKNQYYQIKTKK